VKIINTNVYGLYESVIASGYPKQSVIEHQLFLYGFEKELGAQVERAKRLARCKPGTGHDCFLKGIIAQADFIASHGWWMQAMRYHWFDIVSSQSKEHNCMALYGHGNPDDVRIGDELGARVTTNFLQLKTMVGQRTGHRREEWKIFREWVASIDELGLITNNKED